MKSIYATIALITDCIKVIIDYFNHSIFRADRLINLCDENKRLLIIIDALQENIVILNFLNYEKNNYEKVLIIFYTS